MGELLTPCYPEEEGEGGTILLNMQSYCVCSVIRYSVLLKFSLVASVACDVYCYGLM